MSHPHDPKAAALVQAERAMSSALECLREYQFLSRCDAVILLEQALTRIKGLDPLPVSQGGSA